MDKTQESNRIAEEFKIKIDELYQTYSKGCITQIEKMLQQADVIQEYAQQLANVWLNPE